MSILDSALQSLLREPLKKAVATETKKIKRELTKQNTADNQTGKPTVFDYGVSFNNFHTRIDRPASSGVSFSTLRQFAVHYPIVRACINHLQTQIKKLEWDVTEIEVDDLNPKKEKTTAEKELIEFFKKPGKGKRFNEFVSEIVEDLEVLDAVALYKNKTLGNKVLNYTPIDGATIRLLIDEDGTTPQPPEIAYQQIIRGKIQAEMTTEEMIYAKLHSRTNSPYGLSPLESLVVTVSTALKVGTYNLAYLSEGNVPEGFITLPPDVANSSEQVKEWQNYFDALMGGDPRFQRRLKTVPQGVEYLPTKKADDMSFERFEKWLLQNTCAVFGVPPQAIGFTYEVNKATGETQKDIGEEKGTLVISRFIKELFDVIIQEDFGKTDLHFVWTNIDPVNETAEIDIAERMVKSGIKSIDEVRLEQGLQPIGMDNAFFGSGAPVLLRDYVEEVPVEETPQQMEPEEKEEEQPSQRDVIEENREISALKKWRTLARKWVKTGKLNKLATEVFDSSDIHPAVADKIAYLLKYSSTLEDVDRVFKNYLEAEGSMYRAAIKLNAELNRVAIATD